MSLRASAFEPPYSPAQAAPLLGMHKASIVRHLNEAWAKQGGGQRIVIGEWCGAYRRGRYWKIPGDVVRAIKFGTPRDGLPIAPAAAPCPDCAELRAAFAAFAASLSAALTHLQTITAASGGAAAALPAPPYPQPRSGSQATTQ